MKPSDEPDLHYKETGLVRGVFGDTLWAGGGPVLPLLAGRVDHEPSTLHLLRFDDYSFPKKPGKSCQRLRHQEHRVPPDPLYLHSRHRLYALLLRPEDLMLMLVLVPMLALVLLRLTCH